MHHANVTARRKLPGYAWPRRFAPVLAGAAILCAAGFFPQRISRSTDEWIAWRDSEIKRILKPTSDAGSEPYVSRPDVSDRAADSYQILSEALQADPAFLAPTTRLGKELGRFYDFVTAQRLMALMGSDGQHSNALGYPISDRDYCASSQPIYQLPALLQSQPFLQEMSDPATYKVAIERIEAQNSNLPSDRKWIVVPYLSQFIKSVDRTTYGRILVVIPNEPSQDGHLVDKWVQFAVATPDMPSDTNVQSVSVVAVIRKGKDKTASYLMDFLRMKDSEGKINLLPTPLLRGNLSNNCYDCHKTGVIPIMPEAVYAFDRKGKLVPKPSCAVPEGLNDRISAYGSIDPEAIRQSANGPSIGPVGYPRTDDFIRNSSGVQLSEDSVKRIRAAMKCSACHDSIGKINYPMAVHSSRDVMAFKSNEGLVQSYVEKGWMPPGNSLDAKERHALWRCLSKEYYDPAQGTGIFIDWLRGK